MSNPSMSAFSTFLVGAGLGGLGIALFLRHQYNDAIEDERQRRVNAEKRHEDLRIQERNNDQQRQHKLRLEYQQALALAVESKDLKGAEGPQGAEGNFDLNTLSGLILSGKEFNALIRAKNLKFVKLLTASEKHFNFQYKTGLNTDSEPFNTVYNCFGGLYQTEIHRWRVHASAGQNGQYTHYRPVISYPDDTIVKIEDFKIKAHDVILGEPASLDDLDK